MRRARSAMQLGAFLAVVGVCVAGVAMSGCDLFQVKVPITDVNAAFSLADVSWFEEEETLFVFYQVDAQQGLGPESQIEIAWRTDQAEQPFAPLQAFTPVHTHLPVDCGTQSLCGSMSIHVPVQPRDVQLRLRYHREGAVTLDAPVTFNVVARGPPQTNRSLIVYGVFDETNTHVQWRSRNQFPTVRNEDATFYGLRRQFTVADPSYGTLGPLDGNPYGYGFDVACPANFTPLGWVQVQTIERAIFDVHDVPVPAYPSPELCGRSTVTDATGTFTVAAIARKNPEVEPAFPKLHSPIQENRHVGFALRLCNRDISEDHRVMQVQRLLLQDEPEICIDAWQSQGFADVLATKFRARIDQERAAGQDMVLLFSLYHDDTTGQLTSVIEDALAQVLPSERDKSSPHVSGAFVFDSFAHTIQNADLKKLVLWCPANAPGDDLDTIPSTSATSCPVIPDNPDLKLGPFKFNQLPILPTRAQYLTFIGKYGVEQAGRTKTLTFKAPVRTPISQNVPVGDFGVATFFNNEVLTAAPTDRFSFCAPDDGSAQLVVFRVQGVPDVIPLSALPEVHEQFMFPQYSLGLGWNFPYLTRLDYETVAAGNVTAASFTVPFGIHTTSSQLLGNQLWDKGDVPLDTVLLRCTRFCDHPTFDSAGVYNVSAPFTPTFRDQCYRPLYPKPGDGGFPLDP